MEKEITTGLGAVGRTPRERTFVRKDFFSVKKNPRAVRVELEQDSLNDESEAAISINRRSAGFAMLLQRDLAVGRDRHQCIGLVVGWHIQKRLTARSLTGPYLH